MTPAFAVVERQRPEALLTVVPFLLWFLLASFLPDTMTPKPLVFDIPVRGADLILLFAALISFAGWFCTGSASSGADSWHRNLPLWFSFILGYAAVSTLWAQMDWINMRGMLFSLVFAAAAFVLPYSVISSLTRDEVRSLARLMALGIAVAGALYSAESFFGLGLRSELGKFYTYGFGMERVKGPLFEASTGYMILLPAAGVLLQDWFDTPDHALLDAGGLAALSIALIGLGSRFALIVVGLYLVAIMLTGRGARAFQMTAVTLVALVMASLVVSQYASAERLEQFQDKQRSSTYATSLRIVEERDAAISVAGSGYGSIWPWYMADWDLAERIARGYMMQSTDYGVMLFQPHSVLLLLGVELGAAGLIFFAKLWGILGRLVSSAVSRQENSFAAISVACAGLGMLADTLLFKGPKISAFWWFFLLTALALRDAGSGVEGRA